MPAELTSSTVVERLQRVAVAIVRGRAWRALIAGALGMLAGWDTHRRLAAHPELNALDFTYPWRAAGHLIAGRNPYEHMPNTAYTQGGPFLYPLAAALVAVPVARLPVATAGAVFVGVSVALMAFALMGGGLWRLGVVLSAPFFFSIWNVQWGPLLIAGALIPSLGWLAVTKPNLGLIAFAHSPRWSAVVGAIAVLALSFVVLPDWAAGWLEHIRRQPSPRPPALMWPLGAVGLVGLLRWRTPAGRTLVAMTLVPTSAWFYDQIFLWLVAKNWKQSLALSVCSWVTYVAVLAQAPIDLTNPREARVVQAILAVGLYLPAAIIVWRQPNVGPVPRWLERPVRVFPRWLQGRADPPTP